MASARPAARRSLRSTAVALVIGGAAAVGMVAVQSASSSAPSSGELQRGEPAASALVADAVVTQDDGVLPDGVSVFDEVHPGVVNLDPALLESLRAAATDAATDGVHFVVNSGWRSAEYQHQLWQDAVIEHGSEAEAGRWVAPPDRSAHVSGGAVDIGPAAATAWLADHGAAYGLCQIYANESWHLELRPEAIGARCPPMYADPTHDPRLQP